MFLHALYAPHVGFFFFVNFLSFLERWIMFFNYHDELLRMAKNSWEL